MNRSLRKAYEITNAKISFVSLVGKAANKRTFLLKKEQDGRATFTTYGRIVKAEAENHFVTGIVYEPMVEDSHGNFMTEEEVRKAAYWFMKNGDKVDLQHSFEPLEGAAVVESWVTKADFDINGEKIKKGSWLMTVEVSDDEVWNGIEKGEITGFSMGGMGDYNEEDVELDNVSKNAGNNTGTKKGLLRQLADALGFNVVEKGAVAELYDKRTKGTCFWDAVSSLETTLRHYDPMTDTYIFETDDAKVRECLEDFNSIITSILSSGEPVAKAIQTDRPVEKAGKAMSSKNLETLHGIKESLDTFIKEFEPKLEEGPEDDPDKKKARETESEDSGDNNDNDKPGNDVDDDEGKKKQDKEEEYNVTKQEVEQIVSAAIVKAMGTDTQQMAVEGNIATEEISPQTVEQMIQSAVEKALEPQEQEAQSVTAEQVQEMITAAVTKAVDPVLKSKGLPSNLNGSKSVEKAAGEEHYLHGIL